MLGQGAAGKQPIIYVAVVDSVGNYVYRIPAEKVSATSNLRFDLRSI